VSKEIEKMIELTGSGDYKPDISLRKLGALGRQISRLYIRVNELNRKLALRLTSQASLISFLVGNMTQPVLVCNVLGQIQYISKGYIDRKKANRSELLGTFVEDLSPDIVTQSILSNVSTSHSAVDLTLTREKEQISVHPIYNRDADVSYLVFDFSHEHFFSREGLLPEVKEKSASQQNRRKGGSLFGGIGSFFRRNGKK
jgi:transcriptional regulator with PAS, ATPase and Fis domain